MSQASSFIAKKYSDFQLELVLKLVTKSKTRHELKSRLGYLKKACKHASNSGVLYSAEIENELFKIGESINFYSETDYVPSSNLHILTQCYLTGGHTRVCERWIKFDSSDDTHSVLLVDQQESPIPDFLQEVVADKNGELTNISSAHLEEKIKFIRNYASKFERVVLHIHPNDVTSFVAFANKGFKRPVIFFNHLDHMFWIGSAISDLVVNLRSSAITQSKEHRNIKNNTLLPLPIIEPVAKNSSNECEVRNALSIPKDAKVFITMASSGKYTPIEGFCIADDISVILEKYPNLYFVAIGPEASERQWCKLIKNFGNRVKVLGPIPNQDVQNYLSIANFAIDSYPIPSFTALLDIAANGVPCLSIETPLYNMDSIVNSSSFCKSKVEFFEKIEDIINGTFKNNLNLHLKSDHFREGFSMNLDGIKSSFPIKRVIFDQGRKISNHQLSAMGSHLVKINLKKKFISSKIKFIVIILKTLVSNIRLICTKKLT